jgi:hypothetical protein
MLRARRTKSTIEDTTFLPRLEILEPRLAMTASLSASDNLPLVLSHGGACSCPICSGQNLESLFPADIAQTDTTTSGTLIASSPLSSLPQLSSNSAARVKLYLDFNGNFESAWGSYHNVSTRVFDRDGDATTFSSSEVSTIREIWARVAEDYAPFNVDVTTIVPGSFANGAAVRLAIGGNYSDWFGQSAGGVAYVGGFTNSASNTGYVFEDALGNGNARYVAEAVSHEAGHLFGLLHQSTWANGQLQDEYNSGTSAWAPIMGVGYYANRTTWHRGNTSQGAGIYQDDISILAGATNNFGLRADDFSNSFSTPSALPMSGTGVNFSGLVGSRSDVDVFRFTTGGGNVNFQMNVAQFGNNLDGAIEIRNSAGGVLRVSDPGDTFGASLSMTLTSGSYFLVVRGSGVFGNSSYGNLGKYTVTGTVPSGTSVAAPEISVSVGTTNIADGGTIDFGSSRTGTAVSRSVTVKNVGTAALSVNSITSAIPAGFTLVSNLSTTTLQAGQSASFTLRLNATTAGSFAGNISFQNGDASEGTFNLHLQGSVTSTTTVSSVSTTSTGTSSTTIRTIDDGAAGNSLTGVWRVGTRGRDGDVHVASMATRDTAVSRWNFTSLAPGQYRVYMSWTGDWANASNTPVTIVNGTQSLGTTYLNQRIASAGTLAEGTNWYKVRDITVTGSTLMVVLSNKANGNVVADAVRIQRITTSSAALPVSLENSDAESAGEGVYVASAGIHSEFAGMEQQSDLRNELAQQQSHHELFGHDLDLAPELGLLDETLNLVREVSRAAGASDDSGNGGWDTESLFGEEQDWLAIL